jgi:hypothetical protein
MASILERIEKWSSPIPVTGCWIWTGSLNNLGYGRFAINRSHRGAHRMSWEAHRGQIPPGLQVLHKCDVRCCVNPDHLFLGTASDNMGDMWAKRRHPGAGQRGEKHSQAKLTAEQVAEIRASRPFTKGLAKKYGVSNSRISAIRNNQSWKDM